MDRSDEDMAEAADPRAVYAAVHTLLAEIGLRAFGRVQPLWSVFGDRFNEQLSRSKRAPTVEFNDRLVRIFEGKPFLVEVKDPAGWAGRRVRVNGRGAVGFG